MSTDALRVLHRLFPESEVIQTPALDTSVYGGAYSEPPVVRDAAVVEGSVLRAHVVDGAPVTAFAAFLDGTQSVRIRAHRRGVPIIEGTVAAVIRERRDRKLQTWHARGPIVRRAFYVPLRHVQPRAVRANDGWPVIDTSTSSDGREVSRHPGALRAAAIERIREARESAERELADAWCASVEVANRVASDAQDKHVAPLFMDGGISGSVATATSAHVVGVIKSHQTLYATGDALERIMSLGRGERSSVFRVDGRRTPVVSWYLRLRDPRGQDAMFGLVRVEVADHGDYAARANDVSRWVLAESAPLSLPDGRWDKMVYGVRDCEEFLRAIAS